MKQLKCLMLAVCLLASSAAMCEVPGASVSVRSRTSGAMLHDRVVLQNITLSNAVTTSGLLPMQISLGIGSAATYATVRITSSSHDRIIDLHRAIVAAMQTGSFSLHMYVPNTAPAATYEVNLDSQLFTLLQF